MENSKVLKYVQGVLDNMPADWLNLTTHRLDIYEEKLAKVQFLEQFEALFENDNHEALALASLPTAYDYIRLGHPLSSVLEWVVANLYALDAKAVISFSSKTTPVLAVLRKNLLANQKTLITYAGELPACFDADTIRKVYGYHFEMQQVDGPASVPAFEGTTVFMTQQENVCNMELNEHIDFYVSSHEQFGSIIVANGKGSHGFIAEIQHVRRRETIAMTPANCLEVLNILIGKGSNLDRSSVAEHKASVLQSIRSITGANTTALVASSGLSTQYAIVMGLVDHALEYHPGKAIKIVVPPNCYGGTNDQARRVAACIGNVEVMDLPVDGDNDMVQSVALVLDQIATMDAVPYIIAEIPTNPRVEVPDLEALRDALTKKRQTPAGTEAIAPVFVLDQTFCPNTHFLGEEAILASTQTITYVSGSKFPSGGKCTAGYCIPNQKAEHLMGKIERHLHLCDNEATDLQYVLLAEQMPSMLARIQGAYENTRDFVNYVHEQLPGAKINFVSEELASQGFTPSVFSLDLPTKGNNDEQREAYKRQLNLKLIKLMILRIPNESKFCVSYGQLKGCYWTIPATSTQGTTKEGDKDYIVRVALSANMDLDLHKEVFAEFVAGI